MQIFVRFFCIYWDFFVILRRKSSFLMRKLLFLVSFCVLSAQAVERVTLAELQGDWSKYQNQVVEITDELIVCGSYYDSLVLATERLFCPEERAVGLVDGDSTAYFR